MTEAELQKALADYLRLRHPGILFHSDFGSGAKLTPGQAVAQKRMNGGRRAWPDLFVAEQRDPWCGLFLELKRPGTRLKKRDGSWASAHLAEQAEVLAELEKKGYAAEFAVGLDEAIKAIEDYLGDDWGED